MNEKYISVWIWLINGIIAMTTVLIANNFLINPKNSWTLKINQIPNIKQLNLDVEDIVIPVKGAVFVGRNVTDPKWNIMGKLNLNQLELPPIPEPPKPSEIKVETDVKPPTKAEAFADLQQRLVLRGIFAPFSAVAQIIDTNMELTIVPYSRPNPNVKDDIQLTEQYNIYDDLTEIGLQAKCVYIAANGVIFDYTFSNSRFTDTFRLFLPMGEIILENYDTWLETKGEDYENDDSLNGKNGSGYNSRNKPYEGPIYNEKTHKYKFRTSDLDYLSKNADKEISGLGLRTVRNPKTGKAEGLKVTRVPENSIAKKYDVKKGDVIVSINSHKVSSVTEARAWVNKNQNESTYTVTYIRNGQLLTKTIANPNR